MTWIKICGTTNLEDAQLGVDAGADAVGFVFYEKSPRNVGPQTVREIVAQLPAGVEKVGVFVHDSFTRIRDIVESTGLSMVQLHCRSWTGIEDLIGLNGSSAAPKLIMALPADELSQSDVLIQRPKLYAMMLDSGSAQSPGGTGKTFDWNKAAPLVEQLRNQLNVVVAGGLTSTNVGDAIRILKPYGVDVASGVEAKPGKKDPEKMRAFIQAVRVAEKNN